MICVDSNKVALVCGAPPLKGRTLRLRAESLLAGADPDIAHDLTTIFLSGPCFLQTT
jgi:hypothetical protein